MRCRRDLLAGAGFLAFRAVQAAPRAVPIDTPDASRYGNHAPAHADSPAADSSSSLSIGAVVPFGTERPPSFRAAREVAACPAPMLYVATITVDVTVYVTPSPTQTPPPPCPEFSSQHATTPSVEGDAAPAQTGTAAAEVVTASAPPSLTVIPEETPTSTPTPTEEASDCDESSTLSRIEAVTTAVAPQSTDCDDNTLDVLESTTPE